MKLRKSAASIVFVFAAFVLLAQGTQGTVVKAPDNVAQAPGSARNHDKSAPEPSRTGLTGNRNDGPPVSSPHVKRAPAFDFPSYGLQGDWSGQR